MSQPLMETIPVELGGWSGAIKLSDRGSRLDPSYEPFRCFPVGDPAAEWRVRRESIPSALQYPPASPLHFPRWEIDRGKDRKIFRLRRWIGSPNLWKVARMAPDLSRGDLWTDRSKDSIAYPLREFDQLLFAHFFIQRSGLIVHGAAVGILGEGYLFPAPGGGGKSTWTGLVEKIPGSTVLGDDKAILRKIGAGFRIYGTPWNSRRGLDSSASVPLRGIHFLSHRRENSILALDRSAALKNLLQQAFLPFNAAELEMAVDLLEAAAGGTEVYSFGFRPDQTATDYFLAAIAE